MPHPIGGALISYSKYAPLKQDGEKTVIQWLDGLGKWTHALTLTMSLSKHGLPPGRDESLRRCRLLLNRVNRVCYGRHGTRRKGLRIASAAFMGNGVYGDHPHMHWVLAGPPDMQADKFTAVLRSMVLTTQGLGAQFDIQKYYGVGWLEYMLDHGIEGWVEQLTFAAKSPVH